MQVKLLDAAARELDLATEDYERIQEGLGRALWEEVDREIFKLTQHPLHHRRVQGPIRCALLRRFPYGIFSRLQRDCIEIIAIAHLFRRPSYWRGRVKKK